MYALEPESRFKFLVQQHSELCGQRKVMVYVPQFPHLCIELTLNSMLIYPPKAVVNTQARYVQILNTMNAWHREGAQQASALMVKAKKEHASLGQYCCGCDLRPRVRWLL